MGIRRVFFMTRVVKQWNRLPRSVVEAPFLETVKVRLDGALGSRHLAVGVPVHCRRARLDGLKRSLPTQTIL